MKTYRSMGARVLLRLNPEEQTGILLPEGVITPKRQTLTVVSLGGAVNDPEKFVLKTGDQVMLTPQPVTLVPIDKEERLISVDRLEIVCVIEDSKEGQN